MPTILLLARTGFSDRPTALCSRQPSGHLQEMGDQDTCLDPTLLFSFL